MSRKKIQFDEVPKSMLIQYPDARSNKTNEFAWLVFQRITNEIRLRCRFFIIYQQVWWSHWWVSMSYTYEDESGGPFMIVRPAPEDDAIKFLFV